MGPVTEEKRKAFIANVAYYAKEHGLAEAVLFGPWDFSTCDPELKKLMDDANEALWRLKEYLRV